VDRERPLIQDGGVAPLGWSYMDGAYVADVCRKHGGPARFKTYPNLWLRDFLRWALAGYRRFRPLYHVDYVKEKAKRRLAEKFGWEWYGGHHRESEITDFFISWLLPRRWGIDLRILGWSALVRSGQMGRDEALEMLRTPPCLDARILENVKLRLDLSNDDLKRVLELPRKTRRDFRTYKRTFELLRPLFWALYKAGRVPKSFYVKYCLKERK